VPPPPLRNRPMPSVPLRPSAPVLSPDSLHTLRDRVGDIAIVPIRRRARRGALSDPPSLERPAAAVGTIFHPPAATCGTIALSTIRSSVASPGLSPLRATAESSTRSRYAGRRARESDRRVRAHRDRLLSFWIGVLPTGAALDARRVTVRLERAPLDSGRSASDIVAPFITDHPVGREKGELV